MPGVEHVARFLLDFFHDQLCPKPSRVPFTTLAVKHLLYKLASGVLLFFATAALDGDCAWLPAVARTKRQLFFCVIPSDAL